MKKIVLFLGMLAFVSLGCTREEFAERSEKTVKSVTEITAYSGEDAGKTVLADDGMTVLWSPGDEISVFYGSTGVKFTSLNTVPESKTIFASEKTLVFGGQETGADYLWAVYPYDESNKFDKDVLQLMVAQSQQAKDSTFAPGMFPAIGRSQSTNIPFYNVCGGVCFSLSDPDGVTSVMFVGNNGETLCGMASVGFGEDGKPLVKAVENGSKTVQLQAPEGGFKSGKWYYISMLPTVLEKGFKMYFFKGTEYKVKEVSSSVTVTRSRFGQLENADAGLSPKSYSVTDLSSDGTANCYIASQSGDYKFCATKKGNSSESVGELKSAEVLWESFGTEEKPAVGSVVDYVFTDGNYAYFTVPASIKNGNASIAVRDASGNILWSWHIWVCSGYDPVATAQVYNNQTGTFLDRNLGATSATPGDIQARGLLYQQSRKDPFLNTASVTSLDEYPSAASTAIWPAVVESGVESETRSFLDAHPMTLIFRTTSSYIDKEQSWTSQNESKSLIDPCPAGWRVPDVDVWACALGVPNDSIVPTNYSFANRGWDFGGSSTLSLGSAQTIWYPTVGLHKPSLILCLTHGYYAGAEFKKMGMFINRYIEAYRTSPTFSCAVRCVSESSPAVVKVDSVKTDCLQNFILAVGENRQLSAYVKPDNANLTKLYWISSDTTVAKVGETGLVEAVSAGKCVIAAKSYNDKSVGFSVTVLEELPENAVNLGLSVLWSDRNLGADSPEDFGAYYAWGETSKKATYSWSNYAHCQGTEYSLTKYNNDPTYGAVDSLKYLELSDDAAYQKTSGKWIICKAGTWDELLANTTNEWTTLNKVPGHKLTSTVPGYTDKWIFLPAAGYASDSSISERGTSGAFWTNGSKLNSNKAGCFKLSSTTCNRSLQTRCDGLPIRPVYNL